MPLTDASTVNSDTPLADLNLELAGAGLAGTCEDEACASASSVSRQVHSAAGGDILAEVPARNRVRPVFGFGDDIGGSGDAGIDCVGCDISEFNSLIARVKTGSYDLDLLEREINDIVHRAAAEPQGALLERGVSYGASEYLNSWFAPPALESLLAYRALIPEYTHRDVLRLILSRSARSARLTTHFDLDFPKKPQTEPYRCYKHGRTCKPTDDAAKF